MPFLLMSLPDDIAAFFEPLVQFIATRPNQALSFSSLLIALIIAFIWMRHTYRKRRGRNASLKKTFALLFPRRLMSHKSNLADFLLFFLNQKAVGLAIIWLVVSFHFINTSVHDGLERVFGAPEQAALDHWVIIAIMTVVMYLAYEFAYWLDHYLSHKIPFLWEFHRVHHEAEVLTPMTNVRVHPIDSLVFSNVTAIVTGIVHGAATYLLGQTADSWTLYGVNAILFIGINIVVQLQHSHVWIPFTGLWGKIFMSPAHHQIHHSLNPDHYDKNMGSCLCFFDWLFGTLYVPSKERERLTFGVEQEEPGTDPHSIKHVLIMPFVRAFRHLRPKPKSAPHADGAPDLTPRGRQSDLLLPAE